MLEVEEGGSCRWGGRARRGKLNGAGKAAVGLSVVTHAVDFNSKVGVGCPACDSPWSVNMLARDRDSDEDGLQSRKAYEGSCETE